jgi:uncharacterized membrane protein YqjE
VSSASVTNNSVPAGAANPNGSISELVSGILADGQRLFRQQIEMVRAEFKEDVRRTKDVAMYMGLGLAFAAVGGLMLMIALVFVLNDYAGLPLWSCWAIVGGAFVAIGAASAYLGYRVMSTYSPLPDKSLNALQENVSWIANPQT